MHFLEKGVPEQFPTPIKCTFAKPKNKEQREQFYKLTPYISASSTGLMRWTNDLEFWGTYVDKSLGLLPSLFFYWNPNIISWHNKMKHLPSWILDLDLGYFWSTKITGERKYTVSVNRKGEACKQNKIMLVKKRKACVKVKLIKTGKIENKEDHLIWHLFVTHAQLC